MASSNTRPRLDHDDAPSDLDEVPVDEPAPADPTPIKTQPRETAPLEPHDAEPATVEPIPDVPDGTEAVSAESIPDQPVHTEMADVEGALGPHDDTQAALDDVEMADQLDDAEQVSTVPAPAPAEPVPDGRASPEPTLFEPALPEQQHLDSGNREPTPLEPPVSEPALPEPEPSDSDLSEPAHFDPSSSEAALPELEHSHFDHRELALIEIDHMESKHTEIAQTEAENVAQHSGEQIPTNTTPSDPAFPDRQSALPPTQADSFHPGDDDHAASKSDIGQSIEEPMTQFASSASNLSTRSDLASALPSVSSKATTPIDPDSSRDAPTHPVSASSIQRRPTHRRQFNVRPKVSIPTDMTAPEYAEKCIESAEALRLNPYALHQEEYLMLREHISSAQVTTYLNIRNGILRQWKENPQIAVTREEAVGCAKDTRWFDVASVCFDWLVRRGYINFGCVEIRSSRRRSSINKDSTPRKRRTVAVIGAGMSGLGCARQLEGLFNQYAKRFRDMGEYPPQVVILEGRNRIGGRVYSREFNRVPDAAKAVFRDKRFTAEMGGMIITGFERGNPLNVLVRGQLGLPYYALRSDMTLYDTNGKPVDGDRDRLVEKIFNASLDFVSEYKYKIPATKLIEGNRDLMDDGKDSSADVHKPIALLEEAVAAQPHALPVAEQNTGPEVNLVPVSTDRMTGKVHLEPGTPGAQTAAFKAQSDSWALKAGVNDEKDINLDDAASAPNATLGSVVDEAFMQYKDIVDLSAQDFRIFNWHLANLEYANASYLKNLSARGWDIDGGNEWEGKHTMVVGGYQSVPRGLLLHPTHLNVRHKAPVKRISYVCEGSTGPARIECEDGYSVEADYVVNTIPLGVLKHGNVEFEPPLPPWKAGAIERLGFGVLNKVILVFKEVFWGHDRDIFGNLRSPTSRNSLNQEDYAASRGRFFQWFNVTNTTGQPCLVALMAGHAALDTEKTPNDELVDEALQVLQSRFGARVPKPQEAIVTRWQSDKFARGSYSSAGPNMKAHDYDDMAKPIGNLYFAGEHTTGTHPATVHGAYLSGLRAASEVLESMLGPIEVPYPLILPRETAASLKRKAQEADRDPTEARLELYELEIKEHIFAKIGDCPIKPSRRAANAFALYKKANYEVGRKKCEEGRRKGKGKPSANEVGTMLSKLWKEASAEERKPYEDQAEEQKRVFTQALKDWTEALGKWQTGYNALRAAYETEHPSVPSEEELAFAANTDKRRAKRVATYAEDDGSDVDMW